MPAPEVDLKYQLALLWQCFGAVDQYGQPKVIPTGAPAEVRVRFNRSRRDVKRPDGTTVTLDGEALINQFVGIGSLLWISPASMQTPGQALAYWNATGQTLIDDEKMFVCSYDEVPDVKVRFVAYKLGLMKFKAGGTTG